MEFFKLDDYRQCLRWALERLRSRGERITAASLAEAARIQGPYLSKVLAGQADLNEDQLYLVAKRLRLSSDENHYFTLLFRLAKAQVAERRKEIRASIDEFRDEIASPAKNRNAEKLLVESDAFARYYLNPYMQIVHMYLTIPKWRANPSQLAEALGLASERMTEILATLEALGIIELRSGSYHVLKEQLHLPRSSPLCNPQQALMKVAGVERSRTLSTERVYSFSAAFSANEKARRRIQEEFAEFLAKVESIVREAPSEEVYQVGFDLFPWM